MTAKYDANGLRAYRATKLFTLYYLYDEAGFSQTPLLELNSAGSVVAANGIGADGVRSRYNPTSPTVGTHWYFTYDPQGNLVQRQNENNTQFLVSDTALYDAYGVLRADITPTTGGSSNHRDPIGFGGQWGYYTDYESGLLLLTHRYYDPATGRFVNRDPIGYDGGINLYTFAGGNPINGRDPLGLDWSDFWFGFGKGVGSTVVAGGIIVGAGLLAPELALGAGIMVSAVGTFYLVEGVVEQTTGRSASTGEWIPENKLQEDYGSMVGGLMTSTLIPTRFPRKGEIELPARPVVKGSKSFPQTRIAPFGNNVSSGNGRLPHYHRAEPSSLPKAAIKGMSDKGNGIGRHRPWDSNPLDKSFWDRF